MKDRDQRALVRFRMNSSRIDNGESAARPTGYNTRPGAGFVVHGTSMWPTLHIVRNLYFQRGSLRLTGSLSVRAEGLLKVKVRDSVGARAY